MKENALAVPLELFRFKVSRLFQTNPYDEAFLVKAKLSLTIPMDGVDYSFPPGGLTLLDGMRLEVCPMANLKDLSSKCCLLDWRDRAYWLIRMVNIKQHRLEMWMI